MKIFINSNFKTFIPFFLVVMILVFSGCSHTPTDNDLYYAIEKNDIQKVKKLISGGINLNPEKAETLKPIYKAAYEGHLEILKLLVENGADINKSAPLVTALMGKHYDCAEYLINKKVDPNKATVSDGFTPLMAVASNGDIHWAKKLLDIGAKINTKSKDGSTAWIYASINQHEDVALFLEKNGAEVLSDQLAMKIEERKKLKEKNQRDLDKLVNNDQQKQASLTSANSKAPSDSGQNRKFLKVLDIKSNIDQKGFVTLEISVEFLDNIYQINGTDFLLQKQGTNAVRPIAGYLKDKNGPKEYMQTYKGDKIFIWVQFRLEPGETLNGYVLNYNYIGDPYPIYQFK